MTPYLALMAMVVLTTTGQVLIKQGAGRLAFGRGFTALVRSFFNRCVIAGSLAALVAPFFYFYALTRVDLRVAFSFTGLNYVLVFISGCLIFKEAATSLHAAGIMVVVAGVVVFNL